LFNAKQGPLKNLVSKKNGVLIKFSMEFDCDLELVGKINKIDDFLIA